MFATCRKIWLDTTTYQGHYVAKDVRGAVSFLVGIILVVASALAGFWGKVSSLEAGTALLAFSLGNQTMKEFFKYRNNALAANCPVPGQDDDQTDDVPAGGPPQPINAE